MVIKTKSKQKISNNTSKNQKKSSSKWINNIVYEEHHWIGYIEAETAYNQYCIPLIRRHNWGFSKNVKLLNGKIATYVYCSLCNLTAVRKEKDNYIPAIYSYFVNNIEDSELTCDQRCIIEIL